MTIYVDSAQYSRGNTNKMFCHMVADTIEELHSFAESIGVKRCWYHSSSKYKHYDLNEDQRKVAVCSGAIEISSKELITLIKNS